MPVCEASENHCKDPEKITEWEGIIARHRDEPFFVKLYALRVGLCKSIEDGKIDLDTAIDVFEEERSKLDITHQQIKEII
jgi:hypothetical protein